MQKNIENYNDLQLSSRIAIVQDIIHELEAIRDDSIAEETQRKREHALQEARHLYALLRAEQVQRLKQAIDTILGKKEEEH